MQLASFHTPHALRSTRFFFVSSFLILLTLCANGCSVLEKCAETRQENVMVQRCASWSGSHCSYYTTVYETRTVCAGTASSTPGGTGGLSRNQAWHTAKFEQFPDLSAFRSAVYALSDSHYPGYGALQGPLYGEWLEDGFYSVFGKESDQIRLKALAWRGEYSSKRTPYVAGFKSTHAIDILVVASLNPDSGLSLFNTWGAGISEESYGSNVKGTEIQNPAGIKTKLFQGSHGEGTESQTVLLMASSQRYVVSIRERRTVEFKNRRFMDPKNLASLVAQSFQ